VFGSSVASSSSFGIGGVDWKRRVCYRIVLGDEGIICIKTKWCFFVTENCIGLILQIFEKTLEILVGIKLWGITGG